jgi:hypothetical protein
MERLIKTNIKDLDEEISSQSISFDGDHKCKPTRLGDYLQSKKEKDKRMIYRLQENSFGEVFDFLLRFGDDLPLEWLDNESLDDLQSLFEQIEIISTVLNSDTMELSEGVLIDGFLFNKPSSRASKKRAAEWYKRNKHKVKANKKKIEFQRLQRIRKRLKDKPITPQMNRRRKNHTSKHMVECYELREVLNNV